jgi:hypothetical protein
MNDQTLEEQKEFYSKQIVQSLTDAWQIIYALHSFNSHPNIQDPSIQTTFNEIILRDMVSIIQKGKGFKTKSDASQVKICRTMYEDLSMQVVQDLRVQQEQGAYIDTESFLRFQSCFSGVLEELIAYGVIQGSHRLIKWLQALFCDPPSSEGIIQQTSNSKRRWFWAIIMLIGFIILFIGTVLGFKADEFPFLTPIKHLVIGTSTPIPVIPPTSTPQSQNHLMLPVLTGVTTNIDLLEEEGFQKTWAFLTPRKGRYYFSIEIQASEINKFDIDLRRDTINISEKPNTRLGLWEFYPLAPGEYNTIAIYKPQGNSTNATSFGLVDYNLKLLNCVARVRQNHISSAPWIIFEDPTGTKGVHIPHRYPINDDTMVFVVGKSGRWYEVIYPNFGSETLNLNSETTAWMHEDHLLVDTNFSPDCQYFMEQL